MRRSWLFVPGDRPERFAKAAASGAHAIICDLEDAVAPGAKERARDAVQRWLLQERAFVRINGTGTPWYADDLAALAGHVGLLGVMLPKSETSDQLAAVSAALPSSVPVVPIIESAAGVHAAPLIAAGEGVARIGFGSLDFALDCGLEESDETLLYARSRIVVASRAARLAPPVDGVSTHLEDMEAIAADARRARALGFGGKFCVHPDQVATVNGAFEPSAEELDWARRVVAASLDGSATRVGGQMIDKPVLERARRLLH